VLDVTESENELVINAEVPGMTREDMDISVENGVLTLRGEKKEEETKEEGGWRRSERRYGRFERSIRLPQYADAENIDASYQDGILKLIVPKKEAAKPRSIKIT
jgi:HSP20 family protein